MPPHELLWRDIDPAAAERKARHLRELLHHADEAISAQYRIIDREGDDPAFNTVLNNLAEERHDIERALLSLLDHRIAETLSFALDGDRYRDHTAPIIVLGKIFESLGQLFVRVCQSQSARISKTVTPHFARACELRAAAIFPSSFGIRLTVSTLNDTTGESVTRRGLEDLFRLVKAEDPAEVAATYGPWTIKKYRELILRMLEAEACPKMNWISAYGDPCEWTPDARTLLILDHRLARMRNEEASKQEAEGMLLEASLLRHTFGLSAHGRTIKGKVPPSLEAKVASCFNQHCRIVYEERRVIDEYTEQEKKSVQLIDITSLTA